MQDYWCRNWDASNSRGLDLFLRADSLSHYVLPLSFPYGKHVDIEESNPDGSPFRLKMSRIVHQLDSRDGRWCGYPNICLTLQNFRNLKFGHSEFDKAFSFVIWVLASTQRNLAIRHWWSQVLNQDFKGKKRKKEGPGPGGWGPEALNIWPSRGASNIQRIDRN